MNEKVRPEYNYDRWKFTLPLEEWLKKADRRKIISFEELYEMIAKITGEKSIKTIKHSPGNSYYIAQTQGKTYKFVLEKVQNVVGIVVFYDNHLESYDYNTNLKHFCETYYYDNKGKVEKIFFFHDDYNKKYFISCSILKYKLGIGFTTFNNLPVYRIINNHTKMFDELFKFSDNDFEGYEKYLTKSVIKNCFKVLKIVSKHINSNVTKFKVEVGREEYIEYSAGKLSAMRMMINGNYVIIRDGKVWWEESLIHYEEFTYKDGLVLDGKKNRVDDPKMTEKIINCIEEAQKMYDRFQEELMM